jgi:hypothetical protein
MRAFSTKYYKLLILSLSLSWEASAQASETRASGFCAAMKSSLFEALPMGWTEGMKMSAAKPILIDTFRKIQDGQLPSYVNLQPYAAVFADGYRKSRDAYLPMQEVVAKAIGTKAEALWLADLRQLKRLPFTTSHKDIVAIASSAEPLDLKRAKAVAAVAKRQEQKIHIVWVGDAVNSGADFILLRTVTEATGGNFIDLSRGRRFCDGE